MPHAVCSLNVHLSWSCCPAFRVRGDDHGIDSHVFLPRSGRRKRWLSRSSRVPRGCSQMLLRLALRGLRRLLIDENVVIHRVDCFWGCHCVTCLGTRCFSRLTRNCCRRWHYKRRSTSRCSTSTTCAGFLVVRRWSDRSFDADQHLRVLCHMAVYRAPFRPCHRVVIHEVLLRAAVCGSSAG